MLRRRIPRTNEELPAIGLGTWQTFEVPDVTPALLEVARRFSGAGGTVIDSSPMYGEAERITGDLSGEVAKPFLATKVWTQGKARGIAEMNRSFERMRTKRMDLMQIHNLVDWQTHLATLREWKAEGRIRYIGITHYTHSAFGEMERILRTEAVDFVQLPYNIVDREAEKRLLPAAQDTGTAVLVMRPFGEGALFRQVREKPLPAWAADFDCTSWACFFLKFILAHPAVTCPIPATSSAKHLLENMAAGEGRLPDAATLKRMLQNL